MDKSEIAFAIVEFNREDLSIAKNYLDYYVRDKIQNNPDLKIEDKEILLNFPVVYIHTWKDKNQNLNIYVGESIDLVRRMKDHVNASSNDKKNWQELWLAEDSESHKSLFFSSKEMNKSLCLDIEHELYELFINQNGVTLKTEVTSKQKDYCNKEKLSGLLEAICKIINEEMKLNLCPSSEQDVEHISYQGQYPLSFYASYNPKTVRPEIFLRENIENNYKDDKNLLLEYPVVYLHVWKLGKGDNENYCFYVGETNDIVERTKQHLNNEQISYDYDSLFHEEDSNWHDEIQNIDEVKMFVFAHPQFSTSMTRDIENLLIMYLKHNGLPKNGRGNEQRRYKDKEKMHSLFQAIVEQITKKYPGFDSLSAIKEKSFFMASPFIDYSQEQLAVKRKVLDKIKSSLEDNRSDKHKVLIINGGAGTGKTVIASSIYIDLLDKNICRKICFLVNNKELANVYTSQLKTWSMTTGTEKQSDIVGAAKWINGLFSKYLEEVLPYIGDSYEKLNLLLQEKDRDNINSLLDKIPLLEKQEYGYKFDMRKVIYWRNLKSILLLAESKGLLRDALSKQEVDVTLIDEGHLLAAGAVKGGSIKEAQLPTIVENSKVTVLMVDPFQFVDNGRRWKGFNPSELEESYRSFLIEEGISNDNLIVELIGDLQESFRMNCSTRTSEWIKGLFSKEGEEVAKFPYDKACDEVTYSYDVDSPKKSHIRKDIHYVREYTGNVQKYEIGIFESVDDLADTIENKKRSGNNPTALTASYCWKWDEKKVVLFRPAPESYNFAFHPTGHGTNELKTANVWTMNETLKKEANDVEYFEVGSFHDIQGFDLNYVGVILGKSVKLGKDNKIEFSTSNTDKDRGRCGISKGTPNWKELIQNEIGVLLSRGMKGLYIYICDDKLREAVRDAIIPKKK